MKKDWKNYVKNLDIPAEFLHKDEFEDKYVIENAKFPSAYIEKDKCLEIFINQEEMNAVKTIEELKDIVNQKIDKFSL